MPLPQDCGVYRITNTVTGKIYIGSSSNVPRRLCLHRWDLNGGRHHSPLMQRAWDKHGAEAFVFEKVLVCAEADLLIYEQILIDFYGASDPERGMNIAPRAGRVCVEWTPERRAASSAARMGKPVFKDKPERYARLIAEARRGAEHGMFGKTHSPEVRARISLSLQGREVWNKGMQIGEVGPRTAQGRQNIANGARSGANAKLSMEKATQIRARHAAGESQTGLADAFGVSAYVIWSVVHNRSWT